jgi:uncharacterized damage-inducible protein DinB
MVSTRWIGQKEGESANMTTYKDIFNESLKSQYDFHFDETRRLLDLARNLPEKRFVAKNQYKFVKIHATFAHLLGADRFWRGVLTGSMQEAEDKFDETSLDCLLAWNETERVNWNKYIAGLNDDKLVERVERELPFGTFSFTFGQAMQHVILHGLQCQSDIAQLLTELGHSPGDVDYFKYIAVRRNK